MVPVADRKVSDIFCGMINRLIVINVFILCVQHLRAQTTEPDTVMLSSNACQSKEYHYSVKQLIIPASLIAVGGICKSNHIVDTSNPRVRLYFFDDKLQYVPFVAYTGLGFIPGVKHNNKFGERMFIGGSSFIIMTVITQGLKNIVREPRPDTGSRNSFPSGHTATAFCGAELARIEYGNGYGAVAYLMAVATGIMRVVNNRHWCSDVIAGSGIGILSARIGYWILPWEKRVYHRLFCKQSAQTENEDSSTDLVLLPSYDAQHKGMSLHLCDVF